MAKLRIFILLLIVWVLILFNIERFDLLNINISSTLYVVTAVSLLPTILLPMTGQIRFEYSLIPIVLVYIALHYFHVFSTLPFTIYTIAFESLILVFTLWIGRKISVNLESFETVVDDIVFETDSNRILSAIDGEEAVNTELFRARKYDRPVAVIYVKLPSVNRLRRMYPETFQYQLALEHRYYKSRIARIIEAMVYRVDTLVWYGDNLVICLPETDLEQAEQLATQITGIISSSVVLQVPMGIAAFPTDGLIYSDLVNKAETRIKMYQENDEKFYGDDADFIPPEAEDDPMVTTIHSRKQLDKVEPISAFQNIKKAVSRVQTTVFSDVKLVSIEHYNQCDKGEYHLYHDPDYWVNRIPHQSTAAKRIYYRLKRLLDICAVLVFSPFLVLVGVVVAIGIKLEDGGAVLYSQNRTGLGGHQFRMFKFRSMVENADKRLQELGVTVNERNETIDANGAKLSYDPRITRVGRIIRKTSLDELPQLWNVLRGNMSLVGPRPTSFDVNKYQLYHTERLIVRPGITGLWQIHDRGDTDFDNRLVWDIKYIDKFSFAMDLNVLIRTFGVVINKKGAR